MPRTTATADKARTDAEAAAAAAAGTPNPEVPNPGGGTDPPDGTANAGDAAPDGISDLRRARGRMQGRLTVTLKKIHDGDCAKKGKEELLQLQKRLDQVWEDFSNAHEVYVQALPEAAETAEEAHYTHLHDERDAAVAVLEVHLGQRDVPPEDTSISQLSKAMEKMGEVGKQKLPEIGMPTFDGTDITAFVSYWSKFKTMVDGRKDLDPPTKMTYLKATLKGQAESSITSLMDDEAGYMQAKKMLLARYGQKVPVHYFLVRKLVGKVTDDKRSTVDLRGVYNDFNNTCNTLGQLGVNLGSTEVADILVPILEVKIPNSLLQKWEETKEAKREAIVADADDLENITEYRPTLDEFLNFFDKHIRTRERTDETKPQQSKDGKGGKSVPDKKDNKPSAAALVQQGQSTKGQSANATPKPQPQQQQQGAAPQTPAKKKSCPYCQGEHDGYQCPVIISKSIDERWEMVTAKKACFTCLNRFHSTVNCHKKKALRCDIDGCNGTHNRLLHTGQNQQD